MKGRPTLVDVAKLCGVTPATVSRVLNNKSKFSTSDAVREKIHETAAKVGYVPDLAARNLNRQSTRIIGLFASPLTHVAEGINDSLVSGISKVLHGAGYDVFFELSAGRGGPQPALPFWRFDGAILMQAPNPEIVTELDRRRVPYVCVNEYVGTPVAAILADDGMGMRRAVDHLGQLGHQRIAYANARLGYFTHYSVTERYDTLVSEVNRRGMQLAPGHDVPYSSAADFLEIAIKRGGGTAIITYDHHIAVEIVGAAYDKRLRIPDDFSLICFNDVFPVALLPPPLTAVAVSGSQMGRTGSEQLLNALVAPQSTKVSAREIRIAEDLIVRASTAPPKTKAAK